MSISRERIREGRKQPKKDGGVKPPPHGKAPVFPVGTGTHTTRKTGRYKELNSNT
jgi:hypothetical protein